MTNKISNPFRCLRMMLSRAVLPTLLIASGLGGQALPVEFNQNSTPVNAISGRGMPISSQVGVPPGSDGRVPTPEQQGQRGLTENLVTPWQFQGLLSYGGGVGTRPVTTTTRLFASYAAYAAEVLPRAVSGSNQMVFARTQIGAPYVSRRVEFLFGSVIESPLVNIDGDLLSEQDPVLTPNEYWLREPYWPEANVVAGLHDDAPYYWSPHARAVFANRPGPIEITWRRALPLSGVNAADYAGNPNFAVIVGRVYPLYKQTYLVSGSPARAPRKMYWTEGSFSNSGVPVGVPEGVTVNFIYSDLTFPRDVPVAYQDPGASPPVIPGDGIVFTELRTIFYDPDRNSVRAFNWQGRILLELLGDVLEGDRRMHLGTEIIDVVRRVNPADITVELGERLTAWENGEPDDDHLMPTSLLRTNDRLFAYQHFQDGQRVQFYALRETRNLNDFLLHWTEEGVQGLRWPSRFVRYTMVWPDDIGKYSHYMRPRVSSEEQARATAVAMPLNNVPIIEYQDQLDRPRAKLTETFAFFTHLDDDYPAHRTLLRFMSGENVAFERVFSWMSEHLSVDGNGTLRANNRLATVLGVVPPPDQPAVPPLLSAWNPETGSFAIGNMAAAPRVIDRIAIVGERIEAPSGEPSPQPGSDYWAGHIRTEKGTSYNPLAYVDPFSGGFEAANLGAIIPVNAIPGENSLEIWWFRSNNPNLQQGFARVFWPSVIGRYTLQWPGSPREIILASNAGSGGLTPIEAEASVYTQNDRSQHGYNPNEEHALMLGGQAWALRDDLNITTPGSSYSSEPYVLLHYTANDGRPSMSTFKVLREKPSTGEVFDYVVEAGTILQAPMPLPLLPAPVDGIGAAAVNYNTEPRSIAAGDLPGNWDNAVHGSGRYALYPQFTFLDRKDAFWVYRGLNSGVPALEGGTYNATTETFIAPVAATAIAGQAFSYRLHTSRRAAALRLSFADPQAVPAWLGINSLAVQGTPPLAAAGENHTIALVVTGSQDNSSIELSLSITVLADGVAVTQAPLQIQSTNAVTGTEVLHIGRPPYLAADPVPSNSFSMRFYYKTQAGFAWPGLTELPVGSIVPYLRPRVGGSFVGDAASKTTPSLDIVYRPAWPVDAPGLRLGDTLLTPKEGLPAIRGQTSIQILYQQSIAADITAEDQSVILHDPTREKESPLAAVNLESLPAGVLTDNFQGRLYFPNLPPHLVERVYFDPLRGTKGHLVFKGELREEVLGPDYLLLNVLRGAALGGDLYAVRALCPDGDPDQNAWNTLVGNLSTSVETFREDPAVPGSYIPDTALTVSVGVGDLVEIDDQNTAVDSYALSASGPGTGYVTLMMGGGAAFSPEAEPVSLHIIRVEPVQFPGELKVIAATNPLSEKLTLQHSADLAGRFDEYEYDWRIAAPVNGFPPNVDLANMSLWQDLELGAGLPRYTLGGANIRTLSDNYLIVRYRPLNPAHPLYVADPDSLADPDSAWSAFTQPMLAEGWIKRVLAGINPFNQRITDLFNNAVSTDVSLLTQAGSRWEGDIALNLQNINDYGLIEIYETVLRRGRMLSIDAGINYGPANDALLLAAGYLNDLYMLVGNEAWADAANPTIGIGTADRDYGSVATSMFSFRGQLPSLLEEELALLRGRDDTFLPGTRVAPVYNRLIWNYTRGIDAGEVIYAVNYNIREKPDGEPTGTIDASDAARMYPQGHGDAYGHYLTALKGYYSLFMNEKFDWVPRIEAVLVLGQPVSVDYLDERKFAAAAAALARAGQQVFDLTWRRDYQSETGAGWEHFADERVNARTDVTRRWGMDNWATRTAQGAYLNWLAGNAILPAEDPQSNLEGIQRIDRSTVPELTQLPAIIDSLQTNINNAEAGLTPLGLPEGSIAFDISPDEVANGVTHFEQIYGRAITAMTNAVAAFDDAKDITRMMRSEEDSLNSLQELVSGQEHAFRNSLIELYGTPYPEDIGPGRTYVTDYVGPDLLHYMYVDLPELGVSVSPTDARRSYKLDLQKLPSNWSNTLYKDLDFFQSPGSGYTAGTHYIDYHLGSHGFFEKPVAWVGKRRSPGRLQQGISELIAAHYSLQQALAGAQSTQGSLQNKVALFNARVAKDDEVTNIERGLRTASDVIKSVNLVSDIVHEVLDAVEKATEDASKAAQEGIPKSFIAGLAAGGDVLSAARLAIALGSTVAKGSINAKKIASKAIVKSLTLAEDITASWVRFERIGNQLEYDQQLREWVAAFSSEIGELTANLNTINDRLRALDDAERNYRTLVAEGDRIREERDIFRRGTASAVQGYRTRDAAFRIFRNEKLERYKTLFDLAARYTYLAAQAYDYETGLLGTSPGRAFVNRVIASRSLGVMSDGIPQFAGSNTGDPGLSSVLAEMKADWDVLRGRLGFNNPDVNGTTFSLRGERFRILPGEAGASNWQDVLQSHWQEDIMSDPDVRRHAMNPAFDGFAVPGLVIPFSTTISPGRNFFGQRLMAGDSIFYLTSFATKIFAAGIAMPGYIGMADPSTNMTDVVISGAVSPSDPSAVWLHPDALIATPYVYLIPVGADSMRSPPLGDASTIRTWSVRDVTVPLPFNVGASQFSTLDWWQSSDFLAEEMFSVRKHQAFRPVADASTFSSFNYGGGGYMWPSPFTNQRLIGRSVWNSQWKIVIPGNALLDDSNEGLRRFIRTVEDIQLHLTTYSYSGN